MQYGYFIGCLILFSVWLSIFLARKDLRKEIVFGSVLGAPFSLSEIVFREYWNPPSLFGFIDSFGISIEDVLFCFLAGGIAAVIYEVIECKKTRKILSNHKNHFLPYAVAVATVIILEFIFPNYTIHNCIFALLLGATLMGIKRKDLIDQIIFGGLFFLILYFFIFVVFNQAFPDYIKTFYVLKNFWGISIMGIPLEEFLFAFSVGTFWATLYEFIKGYETKPIKA